MNIKRYIHISILLLVGILQHSNAQNVDFEHLLNGKPFQLKGTVSANAVYFDSNQATGGRAPFTYFMRGSLNASFYQFSMPISYSYSNQEEKLDYHPLNSIGLVCIPNTNGYKRI